MFELPFLCLAMVDNETYILHHAIKYWICRSIDMSDSAPTFSHLRERMLLIPRNKKCLAPSLLTATKATPWGRRFLVLGKPYTVLWVR